MLDLEFESPEERPEEISAAANRLIGDGDDKEYYFEDKDGNWYEQIIFGVHL